MISDMSDNRIVYGYLNKAFTSTVNEQGKIDKGLIKVVFEEVDGKISPINSLIEFDQREEVFLLDGFDALHEKYQQKILKINAIANANTDAEGQTKFVTFKNQVSDVNKNNLCSIIKSPLPDPLNLNISLPTPPHTKIFYLENDSFVYGPFLLERLNSLEADSTTFSGKLRPLTGKSNGYPNLKAGFIYKFCLDEVTNNLGKDAFEHNETLYITNPLALNKIKKVQVEFFTQQHIVEMFTMMANKRVIPSAIVTAIKKELSNIKIGAASKEAVEQVVNSAASTHEDWVSILFDVIKNSNNGQLVIESAVKKQQDNYEKQWIEAAKANNGELKKESEQLQAELDSMKQKKVAADRELFKVQQNIDDKLDKLEQESGFEEELKQKKLTADAELESMNKELLNLQEKHKDLKTVDDLMNELSKLRHNIDYEKGNEKTLEDTIKKLKKDIEQHDAILQERLREMVPYVSSIIQAPIPSKESDISIPKSLLSDKNDTIDNDFAYNIVQSICTKFSQEYGRDYSPSLIASILVANQQNFMSIFSGPPGLGKTSFVRIFSEIIDLKERFKEVAVGRTWTSEREFIGFYNSLTDNFSSSPSGMYQYLKGIEKDIDEDSSNKLILLDEANLSPMEHYAAILLNVADVESAKKIPLGKESITLPQSLRIIGTVNHDMTTEPLSARLLDRSPVIPFDLDFDIDDISYEENNFPLNHSAKVYSDIFGTNSRFLDNSVSLEHITQVVNILSDKRAEWGIPFVISKRKQHNIKKYIEVLTPILSISCSLNFEKALTLASDYAVLYFLLPPITGNGTGLEDRLKAVLNELQSATLSKSEQKLTDMLNRGKYHLDTFNYFNY